MTVVDKLPGIGSAELEAVLAAVPLATLESSEAVIYATDPELRLIYANPGWDRFATTNGAPHLVRTQLRREGVLEVIRGPLREFYGDRFAEALRTSKPVEHAFECSSADVRRNFQMRILPLRNNGLLVINSLTAEEATPLGRVGNPEEYLDENRLINMCSHCRRTQRMDNGVWEWVPAFVKHQPADVSHGLCPVCLEYHYLSHKRQLRG
jgi:hypothetical protein